MTAERIDYATGEVITGELVPFQQPAQLDRSAEGVVAILTNARQWLATAVDMTGPAEIAQAKAVVATAETYSRELHLSKEIQMDATEMVRRAEYALGKAIRKGQEDGTVAVVGTVSGPRADYERNGKTVRVHAVDKTTYISSPTEFAPRGELYGNGAGISHLAEAEPEQFEYAITEAKAEGNLSRANVVRKVQGIPSGMSRSEKAERAQRMANEGHGSRQIAAELGLSPSGLINLRRDFNIEVPADRMLAKRRHADTNRIIGNAVTTLEGITLSLDLIDPADIDPREAPAWADSLTHSLEALRKLNRQIKETIQ